MKGLGKGGSEESEATEEIKHPFRLKKPVTAGWKLLTTFNSP